MVRRNRSDEHGDRVPLGLEDGLLDVSQVLAVRLERKRAVSHDVEAVGVVHVYDIAGLPTIAAGERVGEDARERSRTQARRCDEVETALEARLR